MFSGIVGTLGTVVKAPLNAVIGLINSCIDKINSLHIDIPDWVPAYGGKSFGLSVPKIPYLRKGIANVPYDNYLAYLHQGERVLTKEENKAYQNRFFSKTTEIDYDKLTNCFIAAISKLGLFIDKNTLVGNIAPEMNLAMGIIKSKEERGG